MTLAHDPRSRARNLARVAAGAALALSVGLVVAGPGADARAPSIRLQSVQRIDTASKAAVARAYRSQFRPARSAAPGFHSTGRCTGTTSTAARNALRNALNFARGLNGLAPVAFSVSLDARAQRVAILMAVNNIFTHTPPRSARCWTSATAAAAGKSNLAFRSPSLDPGQIAMAYLSDSGAVNKVAPHRRWVLSPLTTTMGSGSTTRYNALYVQGPTSHARPDPAYTSWPSRGWFPNQLEPKGRWSLSGHKNTRFGHASVKVVRQGAHPKTLKVHKYAVHNGYGRPTLVWQLPKSFDRTATYKVTVSGIGKKGSSKRTSHSYLVKLFTVS